MADLGAAQPDSAIRVRSVLRLDSAVGSDRRAEAIAEVHAFLQEAGLGFAGAPFCICPFGDDEGYGEITVGWPVAEAHEGRERIEPVELPSGRALVFKHTGPYDALGRSYRLMSEVMADGGLQPAGHPVELYETNPEEVENPNDYETVIVWPVGPEGDLPKPQDTFQRRVEVGVG